MAQHLSKIQHFVSGPDTNTNYKEPMWLGEISDRNSNNHRKNRSSMAGFRETRLFRYKNEVIFLVAFKP
jgi:hypothetical protein